MPSTPEDSPWDFSQVLNLINSLSPKPVATAVRLPHTDEPQLTATGESMGGLGDFNKVWEFLGVPRDAPPPQVPLLTPPASDPGLDKEKEAYASDGAVYYPRTIKGVKWRDTVEDGLADGVDDVFGTATQEVSDAPVDLSGLTKNQRKKQYRKARRQAEAEKDAAKPRAVSDLESEDDSQPFTPARKASVHALSTAELPAEPTHRYNLRSRQAPLTPQAPKTKTKDVPNPKVVPYTEPKKLPSKPDAPISSSKPIDIPTKSKKLADSAIPFKLSSSDKDGAPKIHAGSPSKKRDALKSRSSPKKSACLPVTSPAPAMMNSGYVNAIMNQTPLYFQGPGTSPSQQQLKPMTIRDKDDRNIHFLLTLIRNFGEDKHWLVKPAQLVNHTQTPNGVHVFIDFSNIHIGFQNCVKSMRGLSTQARIRREDIDFEALVLLMERRRPVAKRVLVGSLPSIPAFDRAKAIGYETNILDKVFKARELTERQKYFQQREAAARSNGFRPASSGGEGSGSGSETTAAAAPQFAKEAWVEQGVDEILHLKILESVVDVEAPATIVLATGDAAAAEYSQGFMRMVERALKKGWRVELVSWSAGISGAYKNREFRQKWGDAFRIIKLDDYVEDLLDT